MQSIKPEKSSKYIIWRQGRAKSEIFAYKVKKLEAYVVSYVSSPKI